MWAYITDLQLGRWGERSTEVQILRICYVFHTHTQMHKSVWKRNMLHTILENRFQQHADFCQIREWMVVGTASQVSSHYSEKEKEKSLCWQAVITVFKLQTYLLVWDGDEFWFWRASMWGGRCLNRAKLWKTHLGNSLLASVGSSHQQARPCPGISHKLRPWTNGWTDKS